MSLKVKLSDFLQIHRAASKIHKKLLQFSSPWDFFLEITSHFGKHLFDAVPVEILTGKVTSTLLSSQDQSLDNGQWQFNNNTTHYCIGIL